MTQDEIIKLAKAYGFTGGFDADGKLLHDEAFVVAVTEAVDREREACAKLVEVSDDLGDWEIICGSDGRELLNAMANEIRARGEA